MSIDLSQFSGVLLDLDGTIYAEEHALPGAVALIRRLQQEGRRFACLSNSTTSPARIVARLRRMGVEVGERDIFTAAAAAAEYVLERFGGGSARPRVYNLATEGIEDLLDQKVDWVKSDAEACDAVIVGTPVSVFATEERQRVALGLLRGGAALVGICADRVYPSPRGIEFGSGALTSMLAYAANVSPVFCGKPQAMFFQKLCEHIGAEPKDCVLVGDNLESDIAGARGVGMKTILTLTGVTRAADVEKIDPSLRADWVVSTLEQI